MYGNCGYATVSERVVLTRHTARLAYPDTTTTADPRYRGTNTYIIIIKPNPSTEFSSRHYQALMLHM